MVQFVFHPFQWPKSTYVLIMNPIEYSYEYKITINVKVLSEISLTIQQLGNAKIVTLMVKLACRREKNQVPT